MAIFQQGLFTYDPSTDTPETIARKRAIVNQIMGTSRAPKTIGEGFSALGDGIVANVLNRRANAGESAGKASADDMFSRITSAISGGGAIEPATSYLGGVPTGSVERAPLDPISDRVAQAHGEPVKLSGDKQEFISALLPAAVEESKRTGVDPRIIVAQAAQETGWGRSAPGNNFFGIKSHGQGGGQKLKTHEYVNGKRVNVSDSFRTFASPADSVRGYGDFILQNPRYKPLREAQDLDSQLAALQASGYATDPNYSRSVGAIARSIPLPEMAAPDASMTAYAPQQQQGGALASAPFASAGLPSYAAGAVDMGGTPQPVHDERGFRMDTVAPVPLQGTVPYTGPGATTDIPSYAPSGKGDRLPMPPAPAPNAMADPRNQLDLSTLPQGDSGTPYVDPVMSPQSAGYAPQGGLTGQVAPNDPGMFGMGMDPNNPATIPAMAGGTRDILPAGSPGQFPAAPMQQQAPQQAMQGQGGQGGNLLSIPPQMLLEALSNPFLGEEQKAFARGVLEMQMQAQDPYRQAQMAKMQREASGIGDDPKVQTSVVLDDGTSVLVMNNGQRRVLSPTGEVVEGQAAADAIRAARDYTVENQRDIYGGRRAGTLGSDIELGGAAAGAVKGGEKTMEAGFSAWEDYGKLQSNIANLDEAIGALDNGAKSGIVYNMLPNVTEASASLENAMNRMGLDVIGAVTFGALSEGEMKLAMETAVPRNLGPEQLRNWLVRKREAQTKAADMLADAARYLTIPGNTINAWIEKNTAARRGTQQGGAPSGGQQRLRYNPQTGELE